MGGFFWVSFLVWFLFWFLGFFFGFLGFFQSSIQSPPITYQFLYSICHWLTVQRTALLCLKAVDVAPSRSLWSPNLIPVYTRPAGCWLFDKGGTSCLLSQRVVRLPACPKTPTKLGRSCSTYVIHPFGSVLLPR